MKFLIILTTLIASIMAQRPSYAGSSPKGVPELHSRFQDTSSTDNVVGNRFGEDKPVNPNLPTDARGDEDLVNRLNQWPREHRPFWLLNAEQIERHRHPQENLNQNDRNLQSRFGGSETRPIKPEVPRSSFLGSRQ